MLSLAVDSADSGCGGRANGFGAVVSCADCSGSHAVLSCGEVMIPTLLASLGVFCLLALAAVTISGLAIFAPCKEVQL